mmetsp:Transcript_42734/g.129823  ORF Transcript_42734/g.129823 Transcript_42734/m.129823 type:complete len:1180 (-) Transcript_42734:176-3715(-)
MTVKSRWGEGASTGLGSDRGSAGAATPAWEEPDLSDVISPSSKPVPSSIPSHQPPRPTTQPQPQRQPSGLPRRATHASSGSLNGGGGSRRSLTGGSKRSLMGGGDSGGGSRRSLSMGTGGVMMQSSASLQTPMQESTASLSMARGALGPVVPEATGQATGMHSSMNSDNHRNNTLYPPRGLEHNISVSRRGNNFSGSPNGSFRISGPGDDFRNHGVSNSIVDPVMSAAHAAEVSISQLNAAEERLRRFSAKNVLDGGNHGHHPGEHHPSPGLLDAGSQRSLGSAGRREQYWEDDHPSGSVRHLSDGTYGDGGGGARGFAEDAPKGHSEGGWRGFGGGYHGGGGSGEGLFSGPARMVRRGSNEMMYGVHYLRKGSMQFVNYGGKAMRRGSNEVVQVFRDVDMQSGEVLWKKQRLFLLIAFVLTTIGLSVGLVVVGQRKQQNGVPGSVGVGFGEKSGGDSGEDSSGDVNGGIQMVGDSSGGDVNGGMPMLGDLTGAVPLPPAHINEICDYSNLAGSEDMRAECEEVCRPASCCWAPDAESSCFQSQEKMCGRYSSCGDLVDLSVDMDSDGGPGMQHQPRPGDTIVPDPPERLPEYCALTSGQPGSPEAQGADHGTCLDYCRPASCCLERGPNLSCKSNIHNAGSCKFYSVYCSNLPSSELISDYDGRIPSPPKGLVELCDAGMVSSDADAYDECDRLCSPGLCCVGLGLEVDCLFTDREDCRSYEEACESVWPAEAFGDGYFDDGEVVPTPLANICNEAALRTDEGRALCDDVCRSASCCWESGLGNCAGYNDATCPDYSLCPAFRATRVEDGLDSAKSAPVPMQPLDNLCSISSILHLEGLDACKAACALGSCCFETPDDGDVGSGKSCSSDPTCSLYQVCSKLPYEEWSTREVPSPLEYICHPNNLIDDMGKSRCFEVCQPGSCCWADGLDSCFEDDPGRCYQYDPCRANLNIPPAPSTLAETCDFGFSNDREKVECMQACQPAACCWGEGGNENKESYGLCYDANDFTCDEYLSHCDTVKSDLHYGMGPDPYISPVAKACSTRSLQTDLGIRKCREECEPAWCCVAEDPLNCYDSNPVFCAKYAPICGPMLTSDLLYEDDYEKVKDGDLTPIDIICSMKSIMTVAGRRNCEEMCSFAECCFSPGEDGSNCRDENEQYCVEMNACNVLGRIPAPDAGDS